MNYSFAGKENEPDIKQLLADCDLLHDDITPAMLEHFLLGWDSARLVAVAGLEIKNRSALLRSLAVDPAYRNRRIAAGLIAKLEDYAKSLEVGRLYLLTMTAEGFFKKCGYRTAERDSAPAGIQETAEFKSICPASAVCLVKYLSKI